jgi:hypothetical protein
MYGVQHRHDARMQERRIADRRDDRERIAGDPVRVMNPGGELHRGAHVDACVDLGRELARAKFTS